MKILLTDKTDLDLSWPDGTQLVRFREATPIPDEHLDADVVIGWGHPTSLASLKEMRNLKLVQSLSAGVDAFQAAGLPEGARLVSGRGLHDRTVSEHAIALLLALIRELPQYFKAQEEHRWLSEKRGPRPLHDPDRVSTLIDANVLVWGFGSIGQHLAPILESLGANVKGVAQTAGQRAGFDVVAGDQIGQELPNTDVLVMILPATPETEGALDAEKLALLPKHAIVCNVGRGVTLDADALVRALEAGEIAGAALDVTPEEPLPADSPLWDAPNCIVTPHVAGFRADGAEVLVQKSLAGI